MPVPQQDFGKFRGAAIVMGVTSCGKTSVGEALARAVQARFIEGDKLHPAPNIAKMSAGTPLTDDDRFPWLTQIGLALKGEDGAIAACSALKKTYRLRLAEAAERPLSFILLHGSKALLAERIAARKHHFMPPSLLDSQLATLEKPGPDEVSIEIDVALPVDEIVRRAAAFLMSRDV